MLLSAIARTPLFPPSTMRALVLAILCGLLAASCQSARAAGEGFLVDALSPGEAARVPCNFTGAMPETWLEMTSEWKKDVRENQGESKA